MGTRATYRVAFLTSIGIILVALLFFVFDGSKPQEIIVSLTAVVGAIAIWFQMKRARDIAEGEFITTLNESFLANGDVKGLYRKFIEGAALSADDQTAIVEYLTFFETIYLLLERDVIDIKLIDDLFRYRFFIAVTNTFVQDLELLPDARYYTNVYALDDLWTRYRIKQGDYEEPPTSLRQRNPEYDTFVKRGHHVG